MAAKCKCPNEQQTVHFCLLLFLSPPQAPPALRTRIIPPHSAVCGDFHGKGKMHCTRTWCGVEVWPESIGDTIQISVIFTRDKCKVSVSWAKIRTPELMTIVGGSIGLAFTSVTALDRLSVSIKVNGAGFFKLLSNSPVLCRISIWDAVSRRAARTS